MTILETERLIIREYTIEDAPLAFKYSQEDSAKKELPDEVIKDLDSAKKIIQWLIGQYKDKRLPLVYVVAQKESGLFIGHVSLSAVQQNGRKVEIGYAIAAAFQGKGYASEMGAPFAAWGKQALQLENVYGIVKASNVASWRTLEKSGFTLQSEEVRAGFGGRFLIRTYVF